MGVVAVDTDSADDIEAAAVLLHGACLLLHKPEKALSEVYKYLNAARAMLDPRARSKVLALLLRTAFR